MQERLITQVSITGKDDKIVIKWNQDGFEDSRKGKQRATPAFYDSMQSFLSMFIESAGLDSEYWGDGQVHSISLEHYEELTMIKIGGAAKVNNKYASMSSPARMLEPTDQKLVDELSKQAIAYLDGDRSQQSLLT